MKWFEFEHQNQKYASPMSVFKSWQHDVNPPKEGQELEMLEINAFKVRYRFENGEFREISRQDGVFRGK